MANGEDFTVEVTALKERVTKIEKRDWIIGIIALFLTALSTFAAIQNARTAGNSAKSTKILVEMEKSRYVALIKSIDFEFKYENENLVACPLSNIYYGIETIEITPKIEINGTPRDGTMLPYSLRRSDTKRSVFAFPCYEIKDIKNTICNTVECSGSITELQIHYNVYGEQKVTSYIKMR